jgi:hypothetical protein
LVYYLIKKKKKKEKKEEEEDRNIPVDFALLKHAV